MPRPWLPDARGTLTRPRIGLATFVVAMQPGSALAQGSADADVPRPGEEQPAQTAPPLASPSSFPAPTAAASSPPVVSPALAAEPAADKWRLYPPYPAPGVRAVAGALPFGSCTRFDPNVGASGYCAEVFGGVDWVLPRGYHVDSEVGAGWTARATAGDPNLSVSYLSGGAYYAVRLMAGTDLTPLFFWRAGVQGRSLFDRWSPSAQAVGDMGTRVRWLEVGTRGTLGFDGVIESGNGAKDSYSTAFAYGIALFARCVFP